MRTDVRRNLGALLEAAAVVFASSGVDAPAKEITDRAGVGVGTLYRHFPRRSDLILAVLHQEIDECVAAAETVSADHEPFEALRVWVDRLTDLVRTKQGLADALHSADPAYDGLSRTIADLLEPPLAALLARGVAAGVVRADAPAHAVLVAVSLLSQPVPGEGRAFNQRLVELFVEGLRTA